MRLLWLSCLAVATGCLGEFVPRAPAARPAPTPSPVAPDACEGVTPVVGQWPLQRLTSQQLERTVRAVLFDDTHAYAQRLGATDEVLDARLRYFYAASANPVVAEGLMLAAENVAAAAVARPQLSAVFACTASDAAGQRVCAQSSVAALGRSLWRRSLLPGELETVLHVYDDARSGGTQAEGLAAALHALLASPDFFFLQQPQGSSGAQVALRGTALAERLALTLWQEAPDTALLDAAEQGSLDSPEGLEAAIDRLLADPRADLAFADFLKHWLSPEKNNTLDAALASATRQQPLYSAFRAPTEAGDGDGVAFTRALEGYFARSASVERGTLSDFLLDPHLVVNEAVARNLKLPAPADALEVRAVDSPRRAGVLGQPAVLAAFARSEASDPVHRGVFLLRQVLCRPLNPPDMMVNTTLPEATAFKTTRDRFVSATKDSACAGCHAAINPLGFAFENFDAVGGFRLDEAGTPVDATATLPILDATGQSARVDGEAALAAVLAQSPEVRSCLARQFGAWALHRGLTQAEQCALRPHTQGFSEGPGAFSALVRGLLRSPSFAQPQLP